MRMNDSNIKGTESCLWSVGNTDPQSKIDSKDLELLVDQIEINLSRSISSIRGWYYIGSKSRRTLISEVQPKLTL